MKGVFITLEGIEGSGKSTQLEFVIEYFQMLNLEVVSTREPGGTLVGEKIREILLDNSLPDMHANTELMLMFAARVEHVNSVITPALDQGKCVVCDRFYDASYAYQGYGRTIDLDRIDQLRKFSIGNLQPDLTLLLDVSLEASEARVNNRGGKDRFENEEISFYEKVRAGYLDIAKNNSSRVKIINANQSIVDVQKSIKESLDVLVDKLSMQND